MTRKSWPKDAVSTLPLGAEEQHKDSAAVKLSAQERVQLAVLVTQARSVATRRAYASDWARWQAWYLARHDQDGSSADLRNTPTVGIPADPGLVAVYLAEHAALLTPDGGPAYAPSTLARWVSSINQAHHAAGHPAPGEHPLVQAALSGIRRNTTRTPRRRDPLLLTDLEQLAVHITSTAQTRAERIAATRDLAVLTLGLFSASRRSELAALRRCDLEIHPHDGLYVHIRRSKTDQDAQGMTKPIPRHPSPVLCTVCAVLAWDTLVQAWDDGGRPALIRALHLNPPRHHAGTPQPEHICSATTTNGQHPRRLSSSAEPLLRSLHRSGLLRGPMSGHAINEMIRRRTTAAGLDPELVTRLGGHSLRSGFVTEAYRAGASAEEIARQTGHVSLTVLASYQRERDPLRGNAVTRLTPTSPTPAVGEGQ